MDRKEPLSFHFRELEAKLRGVMVLLILSMIGFAILSLEIMDNIIEVSGMKKENMAIYAPTELIVSRLKLAIILAIATILPFLTVRLYQFTEPGLKEREKDWILFTVPASIIAFLVGSVIGYAIVLPKIIGILIVEGSKISINGFFDFAFFVIFGLGFTFQIPCLILGNRIVKVWKKEELEDKKMYIYMAIFGLAFLISPDKSLIIRILLGIIMISLFEISMKIDGILNWGR